MHPSLAKFDQLLVTPDKFRELCCNIQIFINFVRCRGKKMHIKRLKGQIIENWYVNNYRWLCTSVLLNVFCLMMFNATFSYIMAVLLNAYEPQLFTLHFHLQYISDLKGTNIINMQYFPFYQIIVNNFSSII